jgi:putative peptidoglycan lipid II flippase
MVRIVVVAAVLGPTHFADLYQASNAVPNLLFELLIGTLFGSLLVPALVRHFDAGNWAGAARLSSGFLTVAVAVGTALVMVAVLAGPLIVGLLTAGVPDHVDSVRTGPAWLLLSLLLLQVPLYMWVGLSTAFQQARGHFALAAGAPSVENLGITVVLGVYAVLFGTGTPHGQGLAEVALLGGGTTVAVLAHAAVQWWGARRCGARLVPAWNGWRDPEVRGIVRLAVPSVGYASLTVARYVCLLIVAGAVPGGVVAMTIAWAVYMLPGALTARPVAQASLPHLSRDFNRGDDLGYSQGFDRNLGFALFFGVPAGIAFASLSGPLATALAFGEMATPEGQELLRYCMLGISLGVIGQSAMEFATVAAYARRDARRPLQAVAMRAVLAVVGMLVSLAVLHGPVVMVAIGLSIAVSDIAAGAYLSWVIRRPLPGPASPLTRALGRTVLAGLCLLPVVLVVRVVLPQPSGQVGGVLVTLAAGAAGGVAYLGAQWALGSPEIAGLLSLLPKRRKTLEVGRG